MKTMMMFVLAACTQTSNTAATAVGKTVPLKAAKILIEHNATDGDTGFQVFADGEPWKQLEVRGPSGETLLVARPGGALGELGLTELFLETNEPPNDEVPIPDVLAHVPEGRYTIEALGIDDVVQEGRVDLTHRIPRGPQIMAPPPDAEVSATTDLAITWKPVTTTIDGQAAAVTHYQVIVSRIDEAAHAGFGHTKLDVIVPATVTRFRVPCDFLVSHAEYEFEVLALDRTGNQTLASAEFTTR